MKEKVPASKASKKSATKKNAEAQKAKKKETRAAKGNTGIGQSKTAKKK